MSTKLESLFSRYSRDLESCCPALRDTFVCPICLGEFPRESDLRTIVAEEHVIPQALGGRITTLTCRRCNNTAGSGLESHLVQRVLVESRKRPVNMKLEVGGAIQRGELYLPDTKDGPINLTVVPKQSDPAQEEVVRTRLEEGKTELTIQMNLGYIPLNSMVAVVRAAYLLMFRIFAYSYVLDPSAELIRAQIQNPTTETSVIKGVIWRLPESVQSGNQVMFMIDPPSTPCILALLQLGNEPAHVAGMMFPPPGLGNIELYLELQSAKWKGPKTFRHIQSDPKHFLPFGNSWHNLGS